MQGLWPLCYELPTGMGKGYRGYSASSTGKRKIGGEDDMFKELTAALKERRDRQTKEDMDRVLGTLFQEAAPKNQTDGRNVADAMKLLKKE